MENVAPAIAAAQASLWRIFFLLLLSQVALSANSSRTGLGSMSSPVPSSELHALMELKARLANSNQAHFGAWNASNSKNICRTWEGVTCSNVSGQSHIAQIILPGSGLVGSLPPQLGNLTFMFTLNLSSNFLIEGIPSELSRCFSLQILDLSHNKLTGPIPPSLSSLSNLQVLNLGHNSLSGGIPPTLFTNYTSLVQLNLSQNFLTSSIPTLICQEHPPRLQMLLLWDNNLTGPIPSSLGNCSSLVYLQLKSNKLSGPIPGELGSLLQLRSLVLYDNMLSGAIPSSLGMCKNLLKIDLDANELTGAIPKELGDLASLTGLWLYQNKLTGAIPPSLGNCSRLADLELLRNQLTGGIPKELGDLASLQKLYLYHNNLTGAIPRSLGNCSSLVDVELHENQLSGPIPEELGALTSLTRLQLRNNDLTGPIPRSLANCSSLEILELQSNMLLGSIPIQFGRLARLTGLHLWGNNLTGAIPATLGNCTWLVELGINSNQLTGFIPSELMNLKQLQKVNLSENRLLGFELPLSFNATSLLIELHLSGNHVGGSIPAELAQLQRLQYLDLGYNQLSGSIPWDSLANCSSLYQLDLSHNRLAGGLSSQLGRILRLRLLYLNSNFLQGTIPDLGGVTLQKVDLSFNQLNSTLHNSLAQVLKDVQVLDFSHNNLLGSLPLWLGELSMVEVVDLSHNHLTGTIPESLGDCMALTYLNLSNNNLVGDFSLHFSNNSYLSSLDISNNELTGLLPSALQYMKHLRFLNVSFNNFIGPIPHLGVFEHLNASCFQGNPGLCGPIIHELCMQHHQVHLGWKIILLIALATSMVLMIILLVVCYNKYRRSKHRLAKVNQQLKSLAKVRHFSAGSLWESTQGYSEQNLLGEGGVAVVYKGILPSGEVVAVKKFKDGITSSREALLQEVHILSTLKHRNLVKVLGCVLNLEVNALVLEFMPNGSLEQYLSQASDKEELNGLSWEVVVKVAQGVTNALMYLHHEHDAVPIIHGDVKPSNILLDDELEAHLADFGLAKLAKSNTEEASLASNFKGSLGYMAPEFAFAAKITTKADIFSFGVVILEMVTGKGPMHELLHGVSLHEWVKQKLVSQDCKNLSDILHASLLQNSSNIELEESTIWLLLKMAVTCTEELPSRRPTIHKLKAFIDHRLLSLNVSVTAESA